MFTAADRIGLTQESGMLYSFRAVWKNMPGTSTFVGSQRIRDTRAAYTTVPTNQFRSRRYPCRWPARFQFQFPSILLKQMLLVSTWHTRIFPLALCSLNESNFIKIFRRLGFREKWGSLWVSFDVDRVLVGNKKLVAPIWCQAKTSGQQIAFVDTWHVSNFRQR